MPELKTNPWSIPPNMMPLAAGVSRVPEGVFVSNALGSDVKALNIIRDRLPISTSSSPINENSLKAALDLQFQKVFGAGPTVNAAGVSDPPSNTTGSNPSSTPVGAVKTITPHTAETNTVGLKNETPINSSSVFELRASARQRESNGSEFNGSGNDTNVAKPVIDVKEFAQTVGRLQQAWLEARVRSELRIAKLSRENRDLLTAQSEVQSMQRLAELLAKSAESLGETVRRMQQVGAN